MWLRLKWPWGSLDLEYAVTSGSCDTRLYAGILLVFHTVPQVFDHALAQRDDAGVADAHPAPERHPDSGGFARLQQGGGTVRVGCLVGDGERDSPSFGRRAEDRREALQVQLLDKPCLRPMGLGGGQHRSWTTDPGLPCHPVGADLGELSHVEKAVTIVEILNHAQPGVSVRQG